MVAAGPRTKADWDAVTHQQRAEKGKFRIYAASNGMPNFLQSQKISLVFAGDGQDGSGWVRATALDPMLVPRPPLRFAARPSWPIVVDHADRIAHHSTMTAPGVGILRAPRGVRVHSTYCSVRQAGVKETTLTQPSELA